MVRTWRNAAFNTRGRYLNVSRNFNGYFNTDVLSQYKTTFRVRISFTFNAHRRRNLGFPAAICVCIPRAYLGSYRNGNGNVRILMSQHLACLRLLLHLVVCIYRIHRKTPNYNILYSILCKNRLDCSGSHFIRFTPYPYGRHII